MSEEDTMKYLIDCNKNKHKFKIGDTIRQLPFFENDYIHTVLDIKHNGYVLDTDIILPFKKECNWEKYELVKPIFKINDVVQDKERKCPARIINITSDYYIFENGDLFPIYLQNRYEFVSNRFDISKLQTTNFVLVYYNNHWKLDIFSHYAMTVDLEIIFVCISGLYKKCIPYNNETDYLKGKSIDCIDYYKVWEKHLK